jgi:hypothetical protein
MKLALFDLAACDAGELPPIHSRKEAFVGRGWYGHGSLSTSAVRASRTCQKFVTNLREPITNGWLYLVT